VAPNWCSKVWLVETRRYRSQRRASAAAETRRIILDAAREAYEEHGYVRATITAIAARAEVAVNTVYTSVGGKPQLLIALIESAAADAFRTAAESSGAGAATAEEVIEGLERMVESLFIEHAWLLNEVYSNIAADPVILKSIRRLERLYEARVDEAGRRLEHLGRLHAGVAADEAADILWFYLGFGRWKVLRDRGWSAERVRSWLGAQLAAALLEPRAS
jgi:AcrR family transcriptional regulator